MSGIGEFVPVELGALEGLATFRIGNFRRIPTEGGELALSPFRNQAGEFFILVIGEVLERVLTRPTLRPERAVGMKGLRSTRAAAILARLKPHCLAQTVAYGAIAYLIVILNEANEAVLGEVADGSAVDGDCGTESTCRRRRMSLSGTWRGTRVS